MKRAFNKFFESVSRGASLGEVKVGFGFGGVKQRKARYVARSVVMERKMVGRGGVSIDEICGGLFER
jgi:hypothetical protein